MGLGLIPDLVGSFLDHKAQKKGAKQVIGQYNDFQTGATNALTGSRDASVAGYQPFLQGGQSAYQNALAMTQPGYQFNTNDPLYQFQFNEGQRAVDRSAAASGALNSGGTLKALTRFGQGLAGNAYQQQFNNQNALAQFGLQAAQGNAQAQSQYGRGMSDVLLNAARGRSSGYLGKADAKSQLYGDISGAFENAAQDFASIFGF